MIRYQAFMNKSLHALSDLIVLQCLPDRSTCSPVKGSFDVVRYCHAVCIFRGIIETIIGLESCMYAWQSFLKQFS